MLNRQIVVLRLRRWARALAVAVAVLAAAGQEATAQKATRFVARAGVVASSALVTDEIAATSEAEPVTARIGPAPVVALGVRQSLDAELAFEALVGYTFGTWQADDAGGWRDVESVGIAEASVALLRNVDNFSLQGGIGALSYRAPARGMFEGEAGMRPFFEVGAAWRTPVAARRLELQARAQAHEFGTTGIRAAGGLDGNVIRVALSAGYTFGGGE